MISTGKHPWAKSVSLLAASCILGACTSTPAPDDLLTQTEMRVETAEENQAGRQAPIALRDARDQLDDARESMRAESYLVARRQLEKAMANADYAIIKSRSEQMQQAAQEVRQTLETLRSELEAAQQS